MTPAERRAALVEKVARKLAENGYAQAGIKLADPYTADAEFWNAQATAALTVALEEAAQVAQSRYMGDNNREDMEARCIAAAIRALIPK